MSDPAVLIAVRKMLVEGPALPSMVLPNQNYTITAPYLVFDSGPEAVSPVTIDGEERYEMRPQVSLIVTAGDHNPAHDQTIFAVKQVFKIGTKILNDSGDQIAYCLRSPTVDGGFQDAGQFRRNVTLRIVSDQTI